MPIGDSTWGWPGAYSPPLSIDFALHGQSFNVAAVGPDHIVVRDARPVPAGVTTLTITVDDRPIAYEVDVWDGIDPGRRRQPIRSVRPVEM